MLLLSPVLLPPRVHQGWFSCSAELHAPSTGPSLLPELQLPGRREIPPPPRQAGPPEQVWLPGQSLTDLPKRSGGTIGSGRREPWSAAKENGLRQGVGTDPQVSTSPGITPAQGSAFATPAESNGRTPPETFWGETIETLHGCSWWLLPGQSFSSPKGLFPSGECTCEQHRAAALRHFTKTPSVRWWSREIPPGL